MSVKKLSNPLLFANIGFLITHLIWGAAGPVIKFSLEYVPPFTLLFIRFLIVCILLLPYVVIKLAEVKVSKKDYLNLLLLGLLAQSSIAIIFVALKYTTAIDASIISVITGALTVYAGHYFYKEKVHGLVTAGLIITILGTLMVILTPLFFGDIIGEIPIGERLLGNLLALIYNITWVFYVVWSKMILSHKNPTNLSKTLKLVKIKPMTKDYPSSLISAITMYVGLATLIPLAFLENLGFFGTKTFSIRAIPVEGILGVLFLAVVASLVAFTLNQWALEKGKISDSAIISYLGTIFAFPVAYLLLREVPSGSLIVGALVVAFGVALAEIGNNREN